MKNGKTDKNEENNKKIKSKSQKLQKKWLKRNKLLNKGIIPMLV